METFDFKKYIKDNTVKIGKYREGMKFIEGTFAINTSTLIRLCEQHKEYINSANDVYIMFWILFHKFDYLLEELNPYECVTKIAQFKESENIFIDVVDKDTEYECLVTKEGHGFSKFRDLGYQLSGNTKGVMDLGSDYSMQYLLHLNYSGDKKPIIEVHVIRALKLSGLYYDLTSADKQLVNSFIDRQSKFYDTSYDINLSKINNGILLDQNDYLVQCKDNNIVFRYKDVEVTVDFDSLKYISFYGKGNSNFNIGNLLLDLIQVELNKYCEVNDVEDLDLYDLKFYNYTTELAEKLRLLL